MVPHLRRYFIPLFAVLSALALYLYFANSNSHGKRDIRAAVPVEHFRLSNGLTVVVMPNAHSGAVMHALVVKAGGADDPYGKSGLAHYLEHILFTGSENYPEGVYDHTVARLGGEQNAFTTKDYTEYHVTIAREQLPKVMAMEADRLLRLSFDPVKVARELNVITEERNMRVENSPSAQFSEQLNALTFLNHPYHQPTIGWAEDMASFTRDDARAFFAERYRASNMVLVLAGDITASDARRYAQRYYGSLSAGDPTPRVWPKEPPFRLERHATMRDPKVQEPRLLRQYVAPSVVDGTTAQSVPLMLFSQYLGGGETSALYERLVRSEKRAVMVRAEYDPFSIGPAIFRIVATPAPGVSLEELETSLDRALADFTQSAPEAEAFSRSKTQLKAELIFAQDGLEPLANLMAQLYALGLDEQYFYSWSDNLEKVTAEEMRAAASAVLTPAKRVTGYLLPAEAASAPTPPVTAEGSHAR